MQGVIRAIQSGGGIFRSAILNHVRLVQPAVRPTLLSQPKPFTSPARLEEQGFESTTIADILKAKGKVADGSWLWCTTDDTVYDAVKSVWVPALDVVGVRLSCYFWLGRSNQYNPFCCR